MEETFGVLYRDRERQGQKREGEDEEEEEKWQDEEKRENRDENTSRKAEGRERAKGDGTRGQATGKKEIRRLEIKCGNRRQQSLLVVVHGEHQQQRTDHS